MSDGRIHSIDGLRTLAMLLVTAQHCGLAPIGWSGVWLFFVVSGFVIARNFEQGAYAGETRPSRWLDFMRRRFWRIVPVYLAYVAIAVAILWLAGRRQDLHMLPGLLTFTYNWQTIFSAPQGPDAVHLLSHLWTISVEEQFYLAFPLLFLLIGRRAYGAAVLAIVLAMPVARLAWSASAAGWTDSPGAHSYAIYAASFAHLDAFLVGALIARHEERLRASENAFRILAAGSIAALAAYLVAYVALNRAEGAEGVAALRNVLSGHLVGAGREAIVYTVISLLAASAVVSALRGRPGWLAHPLLAAAGRVSYGAYLVHGLVIWCVVQVVGPVAGITVGWRLALLVGVLIASFALAAISWRYLEEPLRRWGTGRQRRTMLVPLH